MTEDGLTIDEWRQRVRAGLRKGLFGSERLRIRVKRVWPNRLEVIFLDAHPADEYGPAAPAGRVDSVHPADVAPLPGLW